MIMTERIWIGIGLAGQLLFTARFLAQWIASERKRDSVVPVAFWWLSLAGGMTLLSYAIYRRDMVFILGQSMGVFIYVRNLMLVEKARRRAARRAARAVAAEESWKGSGPHVHGARSPESSEGVGLRA
jgi:lipid-A-disaccharide synthase-like uncharacterized protein